MIAQGLTGNYITTGPNQYRFTQTFLNGEALCVFGIKAAELWHETVVNIVLVINHVVSYFGPTECLSNQKRYIQYKKDNPQKLTTRQYTGLVSNLNTRMAYMPSLFNDNQQLDASEIVDLLANIAPRTHKATRISQGFNPGTGYLATSVENCERAETTDNIAMAKFSASDKDIDTMKNKNRSKKTKERKYRGKKRHKDSSRKNSSL